MDPSPERISTVVLRILHLALPRIAADGLSFVNEVANAVFIGRSGDEVALAAVGIGNMMQNCIGSSIGLGFSLALNTFASQAAGAKRADLGAIYLQRCRVLASLQLLWMVPVLWFSEDILVAIGQDRAVAYHAGCYNKVSALGMFFMLQHDAFETFLRSHEYVKVPSAFAILTSAMHVFWCWLFVMHFKLGNTGTGLANVVTWFTQATCSALYTTLVATQLEVSRWDVLCIRMESFKGWYEYLVLAVPVTLQTCCQWWFWEILALLVGYFGPVSLAAHVATINAVFLFFRIPAGFKVAGSTLVGIYLGGNKPAQARQLCWACFVINLVLWLGLAVTMALGRNYLALLYTQQVTVCDVIQRLLCIYAVAGFFDTTQAILGGILCGMLWAKTVSSVVFVAFYVLSLPLAILLAVPLRFGVDGVWYAVIPGTFFASATFCYILLRCDWHAASKTVQGNMQPTSKEVSEPDVVCTFKPAAPA